jgi:16S rRNA (guanine527-N7)-methyltransferase
VIPPEFSDIGNVSRETRRRLEVYVDLLFRWNTRINLVGRATLESVWSRHIADSLQLFDLAPNNARTWIDLGAGAGLPGLPVAAMAAERSPGLHLTLVESDARKAAFLRTAAREMGLSVTIEACRIESLAPLAYAVVSARALAPLDRLCELALPFSGKGTVFLFPKGRQLNSELTEAAVRWHIRAERIASRTDPEAAVLRIEEIEPRS